MKGGCGAGGRGPAGNARRGELLLEAPPINCKCYQLEPGTRGKANPNTSRKLRCSTCSEHPSNFSMHGLTHEPRRRSLMSCVLFLGCSRKRLIHIACLWLE